MVRKNIHEGISKTLSEYANRELFDLVESSKENSCGLGGKTAVVNVNEKKVFVKRIPLTDIELCKENELVVFK